MKRPIIPATDFPASWTSCDGIQQSLTCSIVTVCQIFFVPGSLTRLCRIQHKTTSIRSRRNRAITTQCFVKNVSPASGGIIHALRRFLEPCSKTWRMTCFWWQLTNNVTIHTMRLSLMEGCPEINVKNVPTFNGCHLTTHSKSGSCGSRRIGLPVFLWRILETSQHPTGLCLVCPS